MRAFGYSALLFALAAVTGSAFIAFGYNGLFRHAVDLPYVRFGAIFGFVYVIAELAFFLGFGWKTGTLAAKAVDDEVKGL